MIINITIGYCFINGISQLFSFVTQTFPRRNPWRRRQSPSQRGRKCEPWKMSVLPFFQFFSWGKISHFSSKTWGSEATWCSCGLHPRRSSTFGSPVRSSFFRFHDPLHCGRRSHLRTEFWKFPKKSNTFDRPKNDYKWQFWYSQLKREPGWPIFVWRLAIFGSNLKKEQKSTIGENSSNMSDPD